jgi:predicted ArsR family transcriptional regulator
VIPPSDPLVHRALAHPTRVELLRLLEAGPRDVRWLALAVGLHQNTVRGHLQVLLDSGLLTRGKEPLGAPGRPAWRYELTRAPQPASGATALARAAIEALIEGADAPADLAESAGRPWGREAVRDQRSRSAQHAVLQVTQLLDELGFEPEVAGDPEALQGEGLGVHLRRCPFLDLAQRYGEVVCAVHLGALRGAIEELGAPLEAELRPFVQPDRCSVDLRAAS